MGPTTRLWAFNQRSDRSDMTKDPSRAYLFASAVLMVAALTFGGAARLNPLGTMLVELASLPALVLGLQLFGRNLDLDRGGAALIFAILALPLLQLIPMPASLWTQWPGREAVSTALDLAGLPRAARPLSLTPDETWKAALFLLPVAAAYLAGRQLAFGQRALVALCILGVALASVVLAAIQVAAGPHSPAVLFDRAGPGVPVGFFANRNHQAVFLVAALPLTAALLGRMYRSVGPRRMTWGLYGGMFLLVTGAAATLSRAGLLLVTPVLIGSLLLVRQGRAHMTLGVLAILLAGGLGVGGLIVGLRGDDMLQRFEQGQIGEVRFTLLADVVAAGRAVQPAGAGMGAFDQTYRAAERLETVGPLYLNNVHNDYVEIWLEAGWAGVLLMIAFVAWWFTKTVHAWSALRGADLLPLAASLATGAVMIHSIVDYPLRSPAIAVLFGFCCGVLGGSGQDRPGLVTPDAAA